MSDYRKLIHEAVIKYGNARAMAEHNLAYRGECIKCRDELLALIDAISCVACVHPPGTEYCAWCGFVARTAQPAARKPCPPGEHEWIDVDNLDDPGLRACRVCSAFTHI
jgi:hypothetical protein